MAEESVITQEMRDAIGVESEPTWLEIDKLQVRMFARAVGHTDHAKSACGAGVRPWTRATGVEARIPWL